MAEQTETPVEHPEHAPAEGNLSAAASHVQASAKQVLSDTGLDREGPSLATAALIGVGVAIIEPELIPGMLIGAGVWLVPKLLPALGGILRPVVKGAVKAGYSATMAVREVVAEAGEQVEDIVAEARAEHQAGNGAGGGSQAPAPEAPAKPARRKTNPPAANL
jgi:hypothetical protein